MSVWLVSQGRMTQAQMDRIVAWFHRTHFRGFDGRKATGAGPITKDDRIWHEATITAVVEALEANGWPVGDGGVQ